MKPMKPGTVLDEVIINGKKVETPIDPLFQKQLERVDKQKRDLLKKKQRTK